MACTIHLRSFDKNPFFSPISLISGKIANLDDHLGAQVNLISTRHKFYMYFNFNWKGSG
jgi:hypothetical protein